MPHVVSFDTPRDVRLVEEACSPLGDTDVRVATWYSGISAGTGLTAPRPGEAGSAGPVSGWSCCETGEVVEVGAAVTEVAVGQRVHGTWGHRSEAVVPAASVAGSVLEPDVDPLHGTLARAGATALSAVLAAQVGLGDRVAVLGQEVVGLLATRLATLSGSCVYAVDAVPERLEVARELGAEQLVPADHPGGAGAVLRALTGGVGVDAALELSGSHRALQEAVRSVVLDGTVVAAGSYGGGAAHLRLGEEFHHNRVQIVAGSISGTSRGRGRGRDAAWLVRVFLRQVAAGRVEAARLVTDLVDVADAAATFRRLDTGGPAMLHVVLRFEAAPR